MAALTPARRLWQAAAGLACLVPLAAGTAGVVRGAAFVQRTGVGIDLDSHMRYLSGIFLGVGIGFAWSIAGIDRRGSAFTLLSLLVIAGGLARVGGVAVYGLPSAGHVFGLVMELGVVPLLLGWHLRLAAIERDRPH